MFLFLLAVKLLGPIPRKIKQTGHVRVNMLRACVPSVPNQEFPIQSTPLDTCLGRIDTIEIGKRVIFRAKS